MAPRISVLTPSFNYSRFIVDALSSVAWQKGIEVEHVVVDGASSDGTQAVLKRAESHLLWISEPDAGQSDALNKALGLATGDWIAWLNADEFYLPGALAAVMEILASKPSADVIYGDAVFVDIGGCIRRLVPQHRFSMSVLRRYGCYVSSCTTVIRRDRLAANPWDVSIKYVMDWDLWLTLARNGAKFVHLKRPIGAFRVHDARMTAQPFRMDSAEYKRIGKRHGLALKQTSILRDRIVGRSEHVARKLMEGGYIRQLHVARQLRGMDIRWWRGDTQMSAALKLIIENSDTTPQ